jgi:hypothetical protein
MNDQGKTKRQLLEEIAQLRELMAKQVIPFRNSKSNLQIREVRH